ncbi:MAG: hypothetical protein ACR2P5_03635 [Gammaproteobacteria bacterium]
MTAGRKELSGWRLRQFCRNRQKAAGTPPVCIPTLERRDENVNLIHAIPAPFAPPSYSQLHPAYNPPRPQPAPPPSFLRRQESFTDSKTPQEIPAFAGMTEKGELDGNVFNTCDVFQKTRRRFCGVIF